MNSAESVTPSAFYYVDPVDQVKLFQCLRMAVWSLWCWTVTDLSALRTSQILQGRSVRDAVALGEFILAACAVEAWLSI